MPPKSNNNSFEAYLQEQLKTPEFRQAWESDNTAYQIASQVIRYRIARQLSQRDLAKKVGTSQAAICRIESFEYGKVTISTLEKIAVALDIDLKVLFLEKTSA